MVNQEMKIGFNYIPPTAGCGFWVRWDLNEIQRDLSAMANAGAEVVRFFIFWQEFEPRPGKYQTKLIKRLQSFVETAAGVGLSCIPSILTLWMNGQLFDISWRNGRDLWSDDMMRRRASDFARVIARSLAHFDNVFAFDIGDEIIEAPVGNLSAADQSTAEKWYAEIADAIRSAHAGVPIFQANQGHFLWSDYGFNPTAAKKLDGSMIHGFPSWTLFSIESSLSYKAKLYPSFLARLARAFTNRVIIDEFGCYGVSEALLGTFVETAGASCLATGIEALIPWCWSDVANTEKPYNVRPDERLVGFTRLSGESKPVMKSLEAIRHLRDSLRHAKPAQAKVGILVPISAEEEQTHGYLAVEGPSVAALFIAYLLAKRAHLQVCFTTTPSNDHALLIVPCRRCMTGTLDDALRRYVHEGGTLLYSPGSYMESVGNRDLFGIELEDFTLLPQRLHGFHFANTDFAIYESLPNDNRRQFPIIRAAGGTTLAYFRDGSPALVRKQFGKGTALYLNGFFEELLDRPDRLESRQWQTLYAAVGRIAGLPPRFVRAEPHVELAGFVDEQEPTRLYWLAINHGSAPASITTGNSDNIEIAANSFKLLAGVGVTTSLKSDP